MQLTTCAWNDMHDSNDIIFSPNDYQVIGMQAAASSLGMLIVRLPCVTLYAASCKVWGTHNCKGHAIDL